MTTEANFPLLFAPNERLVAFGKSGTKSSLELRDLAVGFADRLPEGTRTLLLLCEDRFYFAAALLGAWARGVVVILPPSRSVEAQNQLRTSATFVAVDRDNLYANEPGCLDLRSVAPRSAELPSVASEQELVELYTSGSEGDAVPWAKNARQLYGEATALVAELALAPGERVVVTVPPQHIYGLLFGILAPLIAGAAFSRETPHFGGDIRDRLVATGSSRLVTVPAHLETLTALPKTDSLPSIRAVSSGSFLAPKLAETLAALGYEVLDVLGSTETGGYARRYPAREERFLPFTAVTLTVHEDETTSLTSPFLREATRPFTLPDRLAFGEDGSFQHLGRRDDVVKIGGKRVSLREIEKLVAQLPGVRTAAAFALPVSGLRSFDIAVALIAPGYDRESLLRRLAPQLDPVALPRRVRFVEEWPLTERGKSDRSALLELFTAPLVKVQRERTVLRSSASEREVRFRWPTHDRAFVGHFEGHPVLPAYVTVSELVVPEAQEAWPDLGPLLTLQRTKWLRPTFPGAALELSLERREDRVSFKLLTNGELSAQGTLCFSSSSAQKDGK